jgi:hypothetical protein
MFSDNDVLPATSFQDCGDTFEVEKQTALKGMLIAGYIMLIVPVRSLLGKLVVKFVLSFSPLLAHF